MKLLYDPDNGPAPTWPAQRHHPVQVTFRARPGGMFGDQGPRCGRDLNLHIWQFTNHDVRGQNGVIDCGGENW